MDYPLITAFQEAHDNKLPTLEQREDRLLTRAAELAIQINELDTPEQYHQRAAVFDAKQQFKAITGALLEAYGQGDIVKNAIEEKITAITGEQQLSFSVLSL